MFYEQIVGLPLIATWTDGTDGQEYCHTLFGLRDGAAIGFFQFADQRYLPYRHLALLVDQGAQDGIRERADEAGVSTFFQDHGFCKSLYITDPNGLILEFTVDHPEVDKINTLQMESAHDDLARWLSGDYSSNNEWHWES